MSFKNFFFGLTPDDRAKYAESCGSSPGMLSQIAYENKRVELGFADVLVARAGGALSIEDLPLTERAAMQNAIRTGVTA